VNEYISSTLPLLNSMGFVYDIYIYIYIWPQFLYICEYFNFPSTTNITKPPCMILGIAVLSTRQRKLRCLAEFQKLTISSFCSEPVCLKQIQRVSLLWRKRGGDCTSCATLKLVQVSVTITSQRYNFFLIRRGSVQLEMLIVTQLVRKVLPLPPSWNS